MMVRIPGHWELICVGPICQGDWLLEKTDGVDIEFEAKELIGSSIEDLAKNYSVYREPAGKPVVASEVGVKHDEGKPRWSLLPLEAVREIVKVLMVGATKYSDNNWKVVDNRRERYYNAAMRHITAWFMGEQNDPEDGLNHLAHAGCCILFLLWEDITNG
jgi:hypothetical protein